MTTRTRCVVRRECCASTLAPKYHALVEDDFQADATTKNDDDELMFLIALRNLFVDAEI